MNTKFFATCVLLCFVAGCHPAKAGKPHHNHGAKTKESQTMEKKPFTVRILQTDEYQPLMKPPKTAGFHSGRAALMPGESVGTHNTKHYEEILVVLEGEGVAVCEGFDEMPIAAGTLVYIPPRTEHNVKNTSKDKPLKYIYIVAPTNE